MRRRRFIKNSLLVALGAILIKPFSLLAAWPKRLFEQDHYQGALQELLQGETLLPSGQVQLKLPPISQNGVEVPATITTTLEQVERIVLMVENNPNPMVAEYLFLGSAFSGFIATRIKMNGSSPVHAIVQANGKFYSATETVTVKKGGCYLTG